MVVQATNIVFDFEMVYTGEEVDPKASTLALALADEKISSCVDENLAHSGILGVYPSGRDMLDINTRKYDRKQWVPEHSYLCCCTCFHLRWSIDFWTRILPNTSNTASYISRLCVIPFPLRRVLYINIAIAWHVPLLRLFAVTTANCTVLKAKEGVDEACAPAIGVLLAKYDLDVIPNHEVAKTIVSGTISECMDDETTVVAAENNIVQMKFVDRNIVVGRGTVMEDQAGGSSGMSDGGIIGLVLMGFAILAGIGFLAYRRRKDKKEPDEEEGEDLEAKDVSGDIEADTTFDMEGLGDDNGAEKKEEVLAEIDDVLFSIETDMKIQQSGENADEFEVALWL